MMLDKRQISSHSLPHLLILYSYRESLFASLRLFWWVQQEAWVVVLLLLLLPLFPSPLSSSILAEWKRKLVVHPINCNLPLPSFLCSNLLFRSLPSKFLFSVLLTTNEVLLFCNFSKFCEERLRTFFSPHAAPCLCSERQRKMEVKAIMTLLHEQQHKLYSLFARLCCSRVNNYIGRTAKYIGIGNVLLFLTSFILFLCIIPPPGFPVPGLLDNL